MGEDAAGILSSLPPRGPLHRSPAAPARPTAPASPRSSLPAAASISTEGFGRRQRPLQCSALPPTGLSDRRVPARLLASVLPPVLDGCRRPSSAAPPMGECAAGGPDWGRGSSSCGRVLDRRWGARRSPLRCAAVVDPVGRLPLNSAVKEVHQRRLSGWPALFSSATRKVDRRNYGFQFSR